MELIAASRIVRARTRVAAARPYSEKITEVIGHLGAAGAVDHKLLTPATDVHKTAYIVVTADRGLCGGYNTNVLRATERQIAQERSAGRDYELVLAGKKGLGYMRFRDYRIHEAFEGFSDQPTYEDARALAASAAALFNADEVQQVRVVYTQFLSLGRQEVAIAPFMPVEVESDENPIAGDFEYEPAAAEILDRLLPRYAEARMFSAMLDAAASEHVARQRAMKSATDNADDLITNLSRVLNRARQDAITTEIMEIVSGAEALKKGGQLVSTDLLEDRIEGRDPDLFR